MDSVPSLVGLILAQATSNAPSGFLVFLWGVATLTVLIGGIWGIPALYALWHDRRTVTAAPPRVSRDMPPTVPPVSPVKGVTDMSDTRAVTLTALAQIPRVVSVPSVDTAQLRIPLLLSSRGWHTLDLARDGDWGVFGTRGSGKGNALQHIALNALTCGPDKVQLVVVDTKGGLDYGFCKRIQHATLYTGDDMTTGIDWLLSEMQRRLDLMSKNDARNMAEYTAKTGKVLPWIVAIYDEIGDFSKQQLAKVETLARMGRAPGIVGFYATQYPTAEVLSSQIQANVTNRLVFRIVSSEYTRVSLRRQKSDNGTYEPSIIPKDLAGVGVLRTDSGGELLGRVPEVTDTWRQEMIADLAALWPKVSSVTSADDATPGADHVLRQALGVPPVCLSEQRENAPAPHPSATDTTDRQQTDTAQTPDRDGKLAMYRLLRAQGIGRDKARQWGVKVDNNLWSEAEKPTEE